MGYRYCPKCKEVVLAKALPVGYKHHQYQDIRAKVRKVNTQGRRWRLRNHLGYGGSTV